MEDLRLKHITGLIKLNGVIHICDDDCGTSFCPTIANFERNGEQYVVGIEANNNILKIHIKNEI